MPMVTPSVVHGPQGGRILPPVTEPPVTFASGETVNPAPPSAGMGPGASMPWEWQQSQQNSQAQQLAANEASGQPVEVSAGVWVYPNGQPVTGPQLAALNAASTVLPSSMNAEGNTVDAGEEAAEAAASEAAATPAPTSWLDESTITASYTNGQVVMAGAAVALLLYLFKRH